MGRFGVDVSRELENEERKARLAEANEALRAIRAGKGEALAEAGRDVGAGRTAACGTAACRAAEETVTQRMHETILSEMQAGYWLVDMEGTLLDVNESYCRMSGYRREELVGRHIWDFETRETATEIRGRILRIRERGNDQFEARPRRRDGTLLEIEVRVTYLPLEGGRMVAFLWDISARRQREEELRRLNRILLAQSRSNQAMIRAETEAIYLNEVCQIVVNECGHTMVWIGLTEQDADRTVRPVACAGFEDGYLDALNVTWADTERGRGPTGTAIRTGRPCVCSDMQTDPRFAVWREQAIERGYASSVALPLRSGDRTLGAITIYAPQPRAFPPDEVQLLSRLADDLAYGLAALRLRQTLRESEQRVQRNNALLQGMNRILRGALDCETEEILGRTCLEVAEEVTQSRFGFLAEINAEGRLDDIAISDPGWNACRMDHPRGHKFAPHGFLVHGIHGRVLVDGAGFFTNDPAAHPDRIGTPEGHPTLNAFLGAPLVHDGRTIGVVAVGNRDGGYGTEDLEALEAISVAIVQALMRRRAEEALRKAHAELESRVQQRTAELRNSMRAVEAERQRFSDVLDQLPAYLVLLSPDYRVPFANRFFRERFGDAHGRRCFEYLFNCSQPCENCQSYVAMQTNAPHHWEWRGPDGRNYDIYDFPFKDVDGSPLILEVGLDITERRQAELELDRHRHRLEELVHQRTAQLEAANTQLRKEIAERQRTEERTSLLSEVTAQLLASDQPHQIVETLCRKIMLHLDCHVFFNFLVDQQRLRLNAWAGISDEDARRLEWLDYGTGVCGCVAREERPVVAEQIQTTADPRADLVRSLGIQAYACHPIVNQGHVIGTLSFGSHTKPAFTADELDLMRIVTDHVALAMQRVRLLEASQSHARAAEAANAAKDRFLANVSHELRTPMGAILGMTELALGTPLPPPAREHLTMVQEAAQGLLELLNEILDFSRMGTGHFELESTVFRPRSILDQTVRTLRVQASRKRLQLICDVGEELPCALIGDPLRLRQILTNLVGNAIKFTAQGKVVLCVTNLGAAAEAACGDSAPHMVLQFSVADTGIGISPADQERIFSPFTQADASTTRQYGGTGLGLAIVSHLVDLMGGRIWVESEVGRGSVFHFTARFALPTEFDAAGGVEPASDARLQGIPLLVGDESAARAERSACDEQPHGGSQLAPRTLRILVVEDTLPNQRLTKAILGERGHSVRIAANGREAAALAGQEEFDLVLMDIQMPIMDGYQATAAIRALPNPAQSQVPIVAMTALALPQDRQQCLAAGMNACLTKPIQSRNLIETVERLARDASTSPPLPPSDLGPLPAAHLELATPAVAVFDRAAALRQLDGREALFREMIAYLDPQTAEGFATIRRALADGDPAAAGRAAHALKGTIVYLGAAPALDAVRRVEQLGRSGDLAAIGQAFRDLEYEVGRLQRALEPYRAATGA